MRLRLRQRDLLPGMRLRLRQRDLLSVLLMRHIDLL
jgi:hypothetical protein